MTAPKTPAKKAASSEAADPAVPFAPIELSRNGQTRTAFSPASLVKLEFDGWRKPQKAQPSE